MLKDLVMTFSVSTHKVNSLGYITCLDMHRSRITCVKMTWDCLQIQQGSIIQKTRKKYKKMTRNNTC